MTCYKCGEPVMGDNIQCDDCRDVNKCDDCGHELCICDEYFDDDEECSMCCGKGGNHNLYCPYDINPYNELLRNGYD